MSTATSSSRKQVKQAFAEHIVELMSAFGAVQAKPMFGGHGIYRQGLMFALIADDRLYIKADDVSQPRFDAQGLGPFTFEMKGKVGHLRYHEAPEEAYDDPAQMAVWAQLGYESAVRQQAGKAAKAHKASKGKASKTSTDAKVAKAGAVHHAVTLADLRNLGPKTVAMLTHAGIATPVQLHKLGAVRAYVKTKSKYPQASLNLLWALEGALTGQDWKAVAEADRASLLMALDDLQNRD